MPVEKECVICGANFKVKPNQVDRLKCCSKQCSSELQRQRGKLANTSFERIYDLYVTKGKSGSECADILGYKNKASVYVLLEKHGITRRELKEVASQNIEYPTGENHPNYKGAQKQVECEVCRKVFHRHESNIKKSILCSKECADQKKRRQKVRKRCEVCGEIFFVRPRRKNAFLCSMGCSAYYRSHQIERHCKGCGNIFHATQSKIDNGGGIYCCKACQRINSRKSQYTNCDNCGKRLKRTPYKLKTHTNHFCNRKCANEYLGRLRGDAGYKKWNDSISYAVRTRRAIDNRDKIEIRCSYCGRWYKPSGTEICRQIYEVDNNHKDFKFYCSDECKKECPVYQQVSYPKGFKRASSREVAPQLRQMCFERDNWECQKCGAVESLHCHHIDAAVQNKIISNDLENTITLCKQCHKNVHLQEGCRYHELQCVKNGGRKEKTT